MAIGTELVAFAIRVTKGQRAILHYHRAVEMGIGMGRDVCAIRAMKEPCAKRGHD